MMRRWRLSVIATLLTIFQLMASPAVSFDPATLQPECDFLKIALVSITEGYPDIDFSHRHLVTSESESFMEVRYDLPPGMPGFVPVVVIDKWRCEIVYAHVLP